MMSRLLAPPLWVLLISAPLLAPAPLLAQEQAPAVTAEEAIETARDRWSILSPEVNPCAEAEENADPDVIVVCREWEDGARYTFDAPPQLTVGADVRETAGGAPRPPDFNDGCLNTRGRANCNMFGKVPPPAIMVDFDALPETPADSEAARLYGGPTDADQPAGD